MPSLKVPPKRSRAPERLTLQVPPGTKRGIAGLQSALGGLPAVRVVLKALRALKFLLAQEAVGTLRLEWNANGDLSGVRVKERE